MTNKTFGETRVRTEFNPAASDTVSLIKQKSAELIDLVETLRGDGAVVISGEKARLISIAETALEEAAMWAVKAATA